MVRPAYQRELRRRQIAAVGRQNQHDRDETAKVAGSLAGRVISPEHAIREDKLRDNTMTLLAGEHGGARLEKPNTIIQGSPGAVVVRKVTVDNTDDVTTFRGVHFRCLQAHKDNADALVEVLAGSTAILHNCIFELRNFDMYAMIDIEATGKAHFVGCSFLGTHTTGNPVHNQGNVLNCSVTGCSNKTGRIHQLTTVIFETT